jgi:tRNA (guanine-N7-)-methyltransferase
MTDGTTSTAGGRFFGRSRGKTLRAAQSATLSAGLARLRIPDGVEPLDPASLFPCTMAAFRLEIGFGGGEHLINRAADSPDVGFIGVEPFVNGMAKLMVEIDRRGLGNIRAFDQDAMLLLRRLPPRSLEEICLLYPDPWPKRRQRKRRFVSAESLALIAAALAPGGVFRFASDIDDYVGWTLAFAAGEPSLRWTAERAADWTTPYPGWPGTRYEAKALREGRAPSYLSFVRL